MRQLSPGAAEGAGRPRRPAAGERCARFARRATTRATRRACTTRTRRACWTHWSAMHDGGGPAAFAPAARALALPVLALGRLAPTRDSLQRRARAALRMQRPVPARATACASSKRRARSRAGAVRPRLHARPASSRRRGLDAALAARTVGRLPGAPGSPASSGHGSWVRQRQRRGPGRRAAARARARRTAGRLAARPDAAMPAERWRLARDWVRAYAQAQAPQAAGLGRRRRRRCSPCRRRASASTPRSTSS